MNFQKITPSVNKKYLVLTAGLMWCGVGIMLILIAASWLKHFNGKGEYAYYAAGFLAAMPIHHLGFLKLVNKNLNRLLPLEEKKCIFSFITWKSYLIIVIMMTMGIAMRHSAIPKQYLSILYNGIGLGLFLSGLRYIRFFIILLISNNPHGKLNIKKK
jgi:hypothetical protein